MNEDIASLRRQLAEAEANLRLIRERKAEFVLSHEVPLQLVKEERELEARIAALQAQVQAVDGAGAAAPPAGNEPRSSFISYGPNSGQQVGINYGTVIQQNNYGVPAPADPPADPVPNPFVQHSSQQSRHERLEQLLRESQARCAARWRVVGLSLQHADTLALSNVGIPPAELLPSQEMPVRLIVGEIGVGKSLMAERVFQQAVASALNGTHAPVPVFIRSQLTISIHTDILDELKQMIVQHSVGIGNLSQHGATIIIDGLDEFDQRFASKLPQAAHTLTRIWPNTTVLLTSRHLPQLASIPEKVDAPLLADNQAIDLINQIAPYPISQYHIDRLPQSVRDAVRRPLFALLFGRFRQQQNVETPSSTGQLLSVLVERAWQDTGTDVANRHHLLQQLAIHSIDRAGGMVPTAEVGRYAAVQPLLTSRLVYDNQQQLGFTLQVFAEWFAAQSLVAGTPTAEEIVCNPQRLERWKYALIIFAGIASADQSATFFSVLASKNPGFTAEIITEGIEKWAPMNSSEPLPPALDCGKLVHDAMKAWVNGIGPLAQLIAPVNEQGNLCPIGVRTSDDGGIGIGWYRGKQPILDIAPLPADIAKNLDWPILRSSRPAKRSAWAWRWSLSELTDRLSRLLQTRSLPIGHGPLWSEIIWNVARAVARYHRVYPRPIAVHVLETYLDTVEDRFDRVGFASVTFTPSWLRRQVNLLYEQGISDISDPWFKIQSSENGSVDEITDDIALEYARAMLLGAMNGYQELVTQWFPTLESRLQTAVIFPARLIGFMERSRDPKSRHIFPIRWHWEALPPDQPNIVDIQMGDTAYNKSIFDQSQAQIRWQRPEAESWLGTISWRDAINVYESYPATERVYHWLWQDLQQIRWVEGQIGSGPRERFFH